MCLQKQFKEKNERVLSSAAYESLEYNGDGVFKNLCGISATLEVKFVVNVYHVSVYTRFASKEDVTHVVMKITF